MQAPDDDPVARHLDHQWHTITAIGPGLPLGEEDVVDATGCVAVPGFVVTHRHMWKACCAFETADDIAASGR